MYQELKQGLVSIYSPCLSVCICFILCLPLQIMLLSSPGSFSIYVLQNQPVQRKRGAKERRKAAWQSLSAPVSSNFRLLGADLWYCSSAESTSGLLNCDQEKQALYCVKRSPCQPDRWFQILPIIHLKNNIKKKNLHDLSLFSYCYPCFWHAISSYKQIQILLHYHWTNFVRINYQE